MLKVACIFWHKIFIKQKTLSGHVVWGRIINRRLMASGKIGASLGQKSKQSTQYSNLILLTSQMVGQTLPWYRMQISLWEELHLSPTRATWPLVTRVHESVGALLWQGPFVQLKWNGSPGKTEPFQLDKLSDHFQIKPLVELNPRPPTQHPLASLEHRLWAKPNSWTDVRAAKWPL